MEEKLLRAYAKTILVNGVALQNGQKLILRAPVGAASFARLVAEEAYALGAADIRTIWSDAVGERIRIDSADEKALGRFHDWSLERSMEFAQDGACNLSIISPDNDVMQGADTARMMLANRTGMRGMAPFNKLTSTNAIRWNVAAVPNENWAGQIFPDLKTDEAVERLWADLLGCAYINDPEEAVADWQAHIAKVEAARNKLNTLPLVGMHFQNSLGTDLRVGLVDDPLFVGGTCATPDGIHFAPNIPTEEVFGVPHKDKAWGTMVSSMPLVYNGNILNHLELTYEDGRLTKAHAEEGNDILQSLIDSDEGARHLGECAMAPSCTPIGSCGHLFYCTLFDENAACHIAMGRGYGYGVGGEDRSAEALAAKGLNDSMIHVDVMVGTPDMKVTGLLADGSETVLFDGDFVG